MSSVCKLRTVLIQMRKLHGSNASCQCLRASRKEMEPPGQCPAKNTTAFRWCAWWQSRNPEGARIAVGRKEMLLLSFIFAHHFCRWKDVQNLLSILYRLVKANNVKSNCFLKVPWYFTGRIGFKIFFLVFHTRIGFKILWKAKIWDCGAAFV